MGLEFYRHLGQAFQQITLAEFFLEIDSAKTDHADFQGKYDSCGRKIEVIKGIHKHLVDIRIILKTVEAEELSFAVLLTANTRNPEVHHSPELSEVVLLNMFQTTLNQFL